MRREDARTALLPLVTAPDGDVMLFPPGVGVRPGLIDALFFPGIPLRLALDAAGSLAERADDLRERCDRLAARGPLARDVFARYPALRGLPAGVRSGRLPIAIEFTSSESFATAATAARATRLTLLVESGGARAALLHGSGREARRVARALAGTIGAVLGAGVRAG